MSNFRSIQDKLNLDYMGGLYGLNFYLNEEKLHIKKRAMFQN